MTKKKKMKNNNNIDKKRKMLLIRGYDKLFKLQIDLTGGGYFGVNDNLLIVTTYEVIDITNVEKKTITTSLQDKYYFNLDKVYFKLEDNSTYNVDER